MLPNVKVGVVSLVSLSVVSVPLSLTRSTVGISSSVSSVTSSAAEVFSLPASSVAFAVMLFAPSVS